MIHLRNDKLLRAHFFLSKHEWVKLTEEDGDFWASYECKACGIMAVDVAGIRIMKSQLTDRELPPKMRGKGKRSKRHNALLKKGHGINML
jgi:hypothetical protein